MRINLRLISCALLMVLVGCAASSSQVRVDQAADVDLTRCRTFDWLPQTSDAASLTDQRVRAAALATLERKAQLVWVPVTVAALLPGTLFLVVPFVEAMRLFTSS